MNYSANVRLFGPWSRQTIERSLEMRFGVLATREAYFENRDHLVDCEGYVPRTAFQNLCFVANGAIICCSGRL